LIWSKSPCGSGFPIFLLPTRASCVCIMGMEPYTGETRLLEYWFYSLPIVEACRSVLVLIICGWRFVAAITC